MSQDTFTIRGREYNPTEKQWTLIHEAEEAFDAAFAEISSEREHDGLVLDGGGDPYHEIGSVYFSRICEIMGVNAMD